ncbi:MAG: protein translocase subunit SecD [Candidatus Paceibacterota bacterium]|jgi:protein-export SecD/SecF family membrane protein
MNRRKSSWFVVGIILVTILGGFFVYPNVPFMGWLGNKMPWRLGLDLVGGAHLVYRIDTSKIPSADLSSTLSGLRDVIEKRVNLFGVSEPQVTISQTGSDYYLVVELAGVKDVSQAIGNIGQTPYLDFRTVVQNASGTPEFLPTKLTGQYLQSAQMEFDQQTGMPYVLLSFNGDGSKIFEDLTAQNVNKEIATFIDGNLMQIATVQEKISGGQARITSPNFTQQQVRSLVQQFNAGALPAPITLESQQAVGASLGADSLKKSIAAGVIATLIIMLFMVAYYRFFGVLASVALVVYIVLSLTIFKVFVTMSLAGIAGFLLSIGMAVDANILIFERTKEEMKRGLSRTAAIKEGFRRAWSSIRDSNISTMLTTLILFFFTTSFIKGLALTLFLGVVVSMFTAITVTRSLLVVFVRDKESDPVRP